MFLVAVRSCTKRFLSLEYLDGWKIDSLTQGVQSCIRELSAMIYPLEGRGVGLCIQDDVADQTGSESDFNW